MPIKLENIREVKTVQSDERANELLKEGWVLLKYSHERMDSYTIKPVYQLGKKKQEQNIMTDYVDALHKDDGGKEAMKIRDQAEHLSEPEKEKALEGFRALDEIFLSKNI